MLFIDLFLDTCAVVCISFFILFVFSLSLFLASVLPLPTHSFLVCVDNLFSFCLHLRCLCESVEGLIWCLVSSTCLLYTHLRGQYVPKPIFPITHPHPCMGLYSHMSRKVGGERNAAEREGTAVRGSSPQQYPNLPLFFFFCSVIEFFFLCVCVHWETKALV
jgi:hypothetical protein